MNIVKTSIGLTKTVKNVSRAREIISVFWRNGFDEFISKTKIHSLLPGFVIPKVKREAYDKTLGKDFWTSVGYRLRKSFEELGPSFIKLGQLISSREDILDPGLIKELKKLQNSAGSIDFELAKKEIERGLGKPIDEIFESIDSNPIGKASIGIAYQGRLTNGDEVVIKVRRPNIEEIILHDFEIISFIVSKIESVSDEFKYLGVSRAIDDFFQGISLELNFLIEAQNCEKLTKNLAKIDKERLLELPIIYHSYTSENILVMSKLKGRAFNEIGTIEPDGEVAKKMIKSFQMFMQTLLVDGFFHADLHGGNFFSLDNGNVGIIDFGLMGSLTRKNRENLVAILYAVVTNNYENLVYEFLDVADFDSIPDHEELIRDIEKSLSPYIGLGVQDIDATAFVNSIVTTLSKHQMYLPRKWFIIFRALMTLDGVGKSLGLNLNVFEIIDEQITDILGELVNKETITQEAMWIGRDAVSSLRIIPRHLKWILTEFAKKKYKVELELRGVERELSNISQSVFFMGLIFFSSILTFAGVFLVKDINVSSVYDIPLLSWVIWGLAFLSFVRATLFMRKN